MDCDFSHNSDDLIRFIQAEDEGASNFIVGSRYIRGANVVNWPLGRVVMSYYASVYVRIITGIRVKTLQQDLYVTSKVLETIPLDLIRFKGICISD